MHIVIKCKNCGKKFFYHDYKNRKFCSKKCKYNYGWIKFSCKTCGKEVSRIKGSSGTHEYCSRECYWKTCRITKKCKTCGKEFSIIKSTKGIHKYCSKKCAIYRSKEQKLSLVKKSIETHIVKKKNGCWEWTASLNQNGYAWLTCDKKLCGTKTGHRGSYIVYKGDIPKGMFVLHKCHNRKCVNPEHLYIGTHKDNMRDRANADRQCKGSKHKNSKLTEKTVVSIKKMIEDGVSDLEISKIYNITPSAIYRIKKGDNWKHVLI